MKNLLMASLVSVSMIPAIAQADTKNFEGLSAGLNLNLISGGLKLSGVDGSTGAFSLDALGGKQTQSASVELSYGFSLGGNSVITVGLDADLSDAKLASYSDDDSDGINVEVKQKNRYGVYVAPGIAITKDALVYAKLGYNKMKGELSFTGGESASENFNGVSFGIGSRIMISKNTFFKVEAARYNFSSKSIEDLGSIKPSATVGSIGLGIKF